MNNKVVELNTTVQRESLSELFGQLAKNSAAIARDEVQLVLHRVSKMVKTAIGGVLLIVTGAAISIAALMCFCAALIIGLTSYMSPVIAALVTGVAFTLVGVVVGFIGYRQLKK